MDNDIRSRTRAELKIPPSAPVVGLVARFDPLKGHADLVRIAPQLIAAHPDLRLLFVGDGWHRTAIEQQVRDAGLTERVIITGLVPLPRVAELYRAMDVMVLPSYQEGQSRTLVEALLAGCPIAAYDVGGIPAVCIDGVTGRLVRAGDRDALREAILWTLDHPAEARQLAEQGRRHVKEHFDQRAMTAAIQLLYDQTLGR